MSKHTPGPGWKFDGVCFVDATKDNGNTQIHRPGTELANFYEAAPDLLEALKHCAAVCAGETMHKGGLIAALEAARAAISKATGEP